VARASTIALVVAAVVLAGDGHVGKLPEGLKTRKPRESDGFLPVQIAGVRSYEEIRVAVVKLPYETR